MMHAPKPTYTQPAKTRPARYAGFGLIELMVTVAVLGILLAVAYPSYQAYITESNRKSVQTALTGFATAMERYRAENNKYTGAVAGTVYPAQAPIDSANKLYNLSIESLAEKSYILRATPINGTVQEGDGYLELTSTGIKRWDRDNSGGISATENSWQD